MTTLNGSTLDWCLLLNVAENFAAGRLATEQGHNVLQHQSSPQSQSGRREPPHKNVNSSDCLGISHSGAAIKNAKCLSDETAPLVRHSCLIPRATDALSGRWSWQTMILLGLHQVGLGPLKVDKLRGYPTCHKTDFLQAWAQKWIK